MIVTFQTGRFPEPRPRNRASLLAAVILHCFVGYGQRLGDAHLVKTAAVREPVSVALLKVGDVLLGSKKLHNTLVDCGLGEWSMVHGRGAFVACAILQLESVNSHMDDHSQFWSRFHAQNRNRRLTFAWPCF